MWGPTFEIQIYKKCQTHKIQLCSLQKQANYSIQWIVWQERTRNNTTKYYLDSAARWSWEGCTPHSLPSSSSSSLPVFSIPSRGSKEFQTLSTQPRSTWNRPRRQCSPRRGRCEMPHWSRLYQATCSAVGSSGPATAARGNLWHQQCVIASLHSAGVESWARFNVPLNTL